MTDTAVTEMARSLEGSHAISIVGRMVRGKCRMRPKGTNETVWNEAVKDARAEEIHCSDQLDGRSRGFWKDDW